jgi:hypothetical protein
MEPSVELKELYVLCCQSQSSGDYAFFEQRFAQQEGVLAIGTDPGEWWSGHATIARVFRAQLEEIAGIQVLPGTPQAYSDGSVGWVAGRPRVRLPDGTEVPLRLTAVFRKEENEWKIVQWHLSAGVHNEDLVGERLTTR